MKSASIISNSSILLWSSYKSNSQRLQNMCLTTTEIKVLRMSEKGNLPQLTPKMIAAINGK